jgi:hypothetical protein
LAPFRGFHDTKLSSHVRFAYHALAIDEQRGPFEPALWNQQGHATEQTLKQVWFAGVHSDIGGGYPDPALAEIPLSWMAERARESGLVFEPGHFQRSSGKIDPEERQLGARIAPHPLGGITKSRKGFYRWLPRHRRELIDPDGSRCSTVASSAVWRRQAKPEYAPANLERYVVADGPIMDVTRDLELPTPSG